MHLYSLCQTWLNLKTHTVSVGEGGGVPLRLVGYRVVHLACSALLMEVTGSSSCSDGVCPTLSAELFAHGVWVVRRGRMCV